MKKVGVIVEGKSDVEFIKGYFSKLYHVDVIASSGDGTHCKITSDTAMLKAVKTLAAKPKMKKIIVVLDLDTKCPKGGQFTCLVELADWYKTNVLKISDIDSIPVEILVATKELESWMLTNWESNTNNKSKEDLKRKMQTVFATKDNLTEMDMVKRFVGRNLAMNSANNKSLKRFEDKISIVKKQ